MQFRARDCESIFLLNACQGERGRAQSIRRRVLTGLERLPIIKIIVDHLGKEVQAPHAEYAPSLLHAAMYKNEQDLCPASCLYTRSKVHPCSASHLFISSGAVAHLFPLGVVLALQLSFPAQAQWAGVRLTVQC